MAVPVKINIATKSNYAARPSVPTNQKESAAEFNTLTGAVRANYDRLTLKWDTDITANTDLSVGMYIHYIDNKIYRITTAYNVSNPITWIANNAEVVGEGITGDYTRAFSEELLFDKKEIFVVEHTMTEDFNFTLSPVGNLDNSYCFMLMTIIADGVHAVNFGSNFIFEYGIINGQILEVGTYEFYILFLNGKARINVPGGSTGDETEVTQLAAPENFVAAETGTSAIDLDWDDVTGEDGYKIEVSPDGVTWSDLVTLSAGTTSASETGLSSNQHRFYRLKALGDGVTTIDSPWVFADDTTDASGDVTAPTVTFDPVAASTDWPMNRPVTLTFNEAIRNTNATEITNANVASLLTVKQTNSGGTNIPFVATIDATKTIVTVFPNVVWGPTQLVYVAINNFEDNAGNEVTSPVSSTFTSNDFTEFTAFDGNLLKFGDILDSVFAAVDTYFELEVTVKDIGSGYLDLITKIHSVSDSQREFILMAHDGDILFAYYATALFSDLRLIRWAGALTGSEHKICLKYNGAIDTNNGLDRCVLEIDDVVAGSKTLDATGGALANIANSTSQLAFGARVRNNGEVPGSNFFSGEAKNLIIRSASTTLLNVPIMRTGTDTSGNGNNGTFN